jgi:hypothetical protein
MGCTGSTGTALGCTALQIQGECVCVCGGGGGNDYGWVCGWVGVLLHWPFATRMGCTGSIGKATPYTARHLQIERIWFFSREGDVSCMQALLQVLPFVGY